VGEGEGPRKGGDGTSVKAPNSRGRGAPGPCAGIDGADEDKGSAGSGTSVAGEGEARESEVARVSASRVWARSAAPWLLLVPVPRRPLASGGLEGESPPLLIWHDSVCLFSILSPSSKPKDWRVLLCGVGGGDDMNRSSVRAASCNRLDYRCIRLLSSATSIKSST
jgi:hypothetical protein